MKDDQQMSMEQFQEVTHRAYLGVFSAILILALLAFLAFGLPEAIQMWKAALRA